MHLLKRLQMVTLGMLCVGGNLSPVWARENVPAVLLQTASSQRAQNLTQAGQRAFQKKQWKQAISLFTTSLAVNAKQPYVLNARGVAYLNTGQMDLAIADFKACREQLPQQALPLFNLGNAYRLQKQLTEAVAAYTEAIALNTRYIAAYNNRGITYSELKNYPAALKDYNQSLKLNPFDLDVRNNRGYLFLLQKDYTKALQDFNAILRKNPRHALAYGNKAQVLYLQGECEAAVPLLEKSCELGNVKACRVVRRLQCHKPSATQELPIEGSGTQEIK